MNEEITKDGLFKWLAYVVVIGLFGMMAIYIAGLKNRLDTLERQTQEQNTIQQTRIDDLSTNLDGVREEMKTGFEDQQKQLYDQNEKIASVKNIVHNTNVALSRANREIEEKETEIQELREEIKKQ